VIKTRKLIDEVDKVVQSYQDLHGLLFRYVDLQTAKDEEVAKVAVNLLAAASEGADVATRLALLLRDLIDENHLDA
jgi:N-acetylglucosamine kinase-like BadF-type ATPase